MSVISDQFGAFVPTNYIWDIQQIQETDADPLLKELLVRMYQNLGLMALVLNVKDTGMYQLSEFVNGQLLFPNPALTSASATYPADRQIWRKMINFGPLAPGATNAQAHNIICTTATLFTRIYATASDQSGLNYVPIPYSSVTDATHNIELKVDSTNVTIITGANTPSFNQCLVVLEYVQT